MTRRVMLASDRPNVAALQRHLGRIERAKVVAEMVEAGVHWREVADRLGVTKPRVEVYRLTKWYQRHEEAARAYRCIPCRQLWIARDAEFVRRRLAKPLLLGGRVR